MRFFFVVLPRVIVAFLAFWLVRGLLKSFSRSKARPRQVSGQLRKDPICGTYVADEISWKAHSGGEELHFCSRECRDAYVQASRKPAV